MLVYGIPYATVFPCIFHTRLIFPYFSLFLLIIFSKDERIFVLLHLKMLFSLLQRKHHAPDILSLCFHSSGFIVIQKRTLNFSLWKCIVCWMLGLVPRGVENNTPSQHWEKYYCQILWDPMSLSIRSASTWSQGVYSVWDVCNIVYLK